jgi:hypothetical protein
MGISTDKLDAFLDRFDSNPHNQTVDPFILDSVDEVFVQAFIDEFINDIHHPETLHHAGRYIANKIGFSNTLNFFKYLFQDCPITFNSVLCENIAETTPVEDTAVMSPSTRTPLDETEDTNNLAYIESLKPYKTFPEKGKITVESNEELFSYLSGTAHQLKETLQSPALSQYATDCLRAISYVLSFTSGSLTQAQWNQAQAMMPQSEKLDGMCSLENYGDIYTNQGFWDKFPEIASSMDAFEALISEGRVYISSHGVAALGKLAYVDPRYPNRIVLARELNSALSKRTFNMVNWRLAREEKEILKEWGDKRAQKDPEADKIVAPRDNDEWEDFVVYEIMLGLPGTYKPPHKRIEPTPPHESHPEEDRPPAYTKHSMDNFVAGMQASHSTFYTMIPIDKNDMRDLILFHEFIHTEQFTQEYTPYRTANSYSLAVYLRVNAYRFDNPPAAERRFNPRRLIQENLGASLVGSNFETEHNAERYSVMGMRAANWLK